VCCSDDYKCPKLPSAPTDFRNRRRSCYPYSGLVQCTKCNISCTNGECINHQLHCCSIMVPSPTRPRAVTVGKYITLFLKRVLRTLSLSSFYHTRKDQKSYAELCQYLYYPVQGRCKGNIVCVGLVLADKWHQQTWGRLYNMGHIMTLADHHSKSDMLHALLQTFRLLTCSSVILYSLLICKTSWVSVHCQFFMKKQRHLWHYSYL